MKPTDDVFPLFYVTCLLKTCGAFTVSLELELSLQPAAEPSATIDFNAIYNITILVFLYINVAPFHCYLCPVSVHLS